MPQRSFVLLVLIILAGLWTPPQRTQAQAECPEGGCKVFLPLVRNNILATATVTGLSSPRYCIEIMISVAVTNITVEPITKVEINGIVRTPGTSKEYPFTATTEDVLFPGETNRYSYLVDLQTDQVCVDENTTATIHVTGASRVPQFESIDVVSRTLILERSCNGSSVYRLSGTIRNNRPASLSNVKAILIYSDVELFLDLNQSTLASGVSLEFTTRFREDIDPIGPCYDEPRTVSPDRFIVRSWGEITP